MNHFLLVTGSISECLGRGHIFGHYKTIEHYSIVQGSRWSISYASQLGGLGAYQHDRRRFLHVNDKTLDLFWFGHAWSETDDAQPSLSLLEKNAGQLSNLKLIELARENSIGVFALILIDKASGEIVVAADSLGSFHIYYRNLQDGLAVSNSSALLAGLSPHSSLDPIGVQELCSNSVANEDRTIWADVKKLRGGQILKINLQTPRPELIAHRPLLSVLDGIRDYAAKPVPALFDAISGVLQTIEAAGGRSQESHDLPWVADLTGGNDSRALMAAIITNHIHVASTVTGPPNDPDVRIGEHLAQLLGLAHYTRSPPGPVTVAQFFDALQLTDGEFDAVEYSAVAAVHRQHIRDGLQFSLNGSFAELGRGHAWRMGLPGMLFPDYMARKLKSREPLTLRHPSIDRWNKLISIKNPTNLFSSDARATCTDYFSGIFGRLMSFAGHLPQHAQLDLIHTDLRMERWQGRLASSTNQLWPAISPWGFQEPLAQMLTTSPVIRRNGLLIREFISDYTPVLAQEPLYTGNPAMPLSLQNAHKFLPVIPFFANRAWQRIHTIFHRRKSDKAPSAKMRQPLICADPEIGKWLTEPLLAETGLFDNDVLVRMLLPSQPQVPRTYQLWCRLLTAEAALHFQKK